MFSERPSQRKVVGVSRRYLQHEEREWRRVRAVERFCSEDLDLVCASSISYTIAAAAVASCMMMPVQTLRKRFLHNEWLREEPGRDEDRLEQFAFNKLSPHDRSRLPHVTTMLGR